MSEYIRKITYFLTDQIWSIDTSALTRGRSFLINSIRFIYITIREFSVNELTLRAMSLVYTTLLSIVPLLAFSISILKAFGVVENQIEPLLQNFLEPLGEQGREISTKIVEFIDRINFGVLGVIGLLLLIYTSVSVINKIEDSLNRIWKVKRGRSLARRFSDYITIILIGPVLMVVALGLIATLESNTIVDKIVSIKAVGTLLLISGQIVPYLVVILVFSFIYILIPNTKVNFTSALFGGVLAGIAWRVTSWVFTFSIASSTKYAAIYSSLAILIIFMIWLYLNWLILLIGAQLAFCHQNLKFLTVKKEVFNLSTKLKEKLTLVIMYLIGYSFYHDKQRWTLHTLTEHLKLPHETVEDAVKELEESRLLKETGDDPPELMPSMALENIKLSDILSSTREGYHSSELEQKYLSLPEVDSVSSEVEDAIDKALGEKSLRDLVIQGQEPEL